jgi:Raf kinase inhibitor-like YbhB/YbcL family protein
LKSAYNYFNSKPGFAQKEQNLPILQRIENQFMTLTSDAIGEDGLFDARYTCDLDNSSPELRWENIPDGVSGFAVIAEDLDAPRGVFTHWIIYNIPADVHHLPAGIPPQDTLPNGIKQGLNSYGKLGYVGPCPPLGDTPHRYIFNLYALSKVPALVSRMNESVLRQTISPYVIATAQLQGKYMRRIQKAG